MSDEQDKELSADELECLWAIARRGAMQERLAESEGTSLERRGLIEFSHGWPTLTVAGRRALDTICAEAFLNKDKHAEIPQDVEFVKSPSKNE